MIDTNLLNFYSGDTALNLQNEWSLFIVYDSIELQCLVQFGLLEHSN